MNKPEENVCPHVGEGEACEVCQPPVEPKPKKKGFWDKLGNALGEWKFGG